MHPTVSVVSLAYNRRQNVHELLTALRRQTHPSIEVILVDNASSDGTAELVSRDFPEVRLIETGSNLNMVAYNLGFEAAQGEYILVIDDDGLPASDDWIQQIIVRFEANPRLGAACTTIRMRDTGRIAHDSPQFVPKGNDEEGYASVAFNGTGAGVRAAALRDAGGYPWRFDITYLELHLCTRVLASGWQVRHFPAIETWHSRPSDSSNPPMSYHGLRNYLWYIWECYPWPYMFTETFHELGWRLKLVNDQQVPVGRLYQATRDAFFGARQALLQRHPVSLETLQYMRWVRNHGNWHGLAPEVRPFDLEPSATV